MGIIQKIQEELMEKAYGKESKENREKGLCISCKEPAVANCYSAEGKREYKISGLCEKCYDDLFNDLI